MIVPPADTVTSAASLHVQGQHARVLLATITRGSGGQGPGGTRTLSGLRAMTLPAADPRAVADALEAAGVQVLVRVLSSAQTIAKPAPLAESGAAEALDALVLIAESELPGTLPRHRRAVGVVRPGAGRFPGRASIGLLTAWPALAPGQAGDAASTLSHVHFPCPEIAIAEAAALAALAQATGGCEQAVYVDASTASGCMIAAGPKRTLARVFRLASGESTPETLTRTIDETARAAGCDRPVALAPVAPGQQSLVLDPAPAGLPIPAELRDASWRNSFGLAYGALAAYTSADAALASLVNLYEREPKAKPPAWERAIRWFGIPLRAAAAVALCIAVLLALPFGIAYARYADLKKSTGGDATISTRTADAERQVAFYRLLRERRWPMTKLMADIADAAPVGVVLESLDLNQPETSVTLRGTATTSDLVTTLREHLISTRIFTQVNTPNISTGSASGAQDKDAGVQFTLNAKVVPPAATIAAKPIDDFAERPLVDRLYGAGSSRRADTSSASGSRPGRGGGAGNAGGSGRNDRRPGRNAAGQRAATIAETPAPSTSVSRPSAASPPDVPAALSTDKIAKLDFNQAMLEWAKRKRAATQAGVDDATRRRLIDESEKAKARMDETKPGASGAGGVK